MESSYQAPIDVENPNPTLATSMKSKFKDLPHLSSECCIYRVPERLRSIKEKAYTPRVVSIGPLHHGKDGLKAMEKHKMRSLRDYIQRTGVSLEYYINIVKNNESKLRSCYEETIEFSSNEFVEIILVDSAFIIEVLLRTCIEEFQKEKCDRIFHKPWMLLDVGPDLQLLENQLPFFILEDLFYPEKIIVPSKHTEKLSIIKLSFKFFTSLMHLEGTKENLMMAMEDTEENLMVTMSSVGIYHLVDFMIFLFLPLDSVNLRKGGKCQSLTIPSITDLHQAGVKFEESQGKNLFDIYFKNGILKIPKLTINGATDLAIRNLVAFQKCHFNGNYINDYVLIMDQLVNTPKDVELLVKHRIVDNMLGDNSEGSTLINELAYGVTMNADNFHFADIFENLNNYYQKSWHKWKANLKQNYFNTPWAIVSVIAAVLIIILTVIQGVCSIISVS